MVAAIPFRYIALLAVALSLATPPLAADTPPDAATLVAGLSGRWTGTLDTHGHCAAAPIGSAIAATACRQKMKLPWARLGIQRNISQLKMPLFIKPSQI